MKHVACGAAFILLAVAAAASAAPVRTIALKAGPSAVAVTDQSAGHVRFRVDVASLQALSVDTAKGTFTRIAIPGFHNSMVEGAPELPMMNRLLAIPAGARVRLETTGVKTRLVDLGALGFAAPLLPHQPPAFRDDDPAALPFVLDRAAYDQALVSRELARVVPVGRLRAMDVGRLEISPVEYLPRENRLRVTEEFEFVVTFEGADVAAQRDLIARTRSPFFEKVYDRVANAAGFHDNYPDLVREVVTMAIVTPPQFVDMLQPFIEWKTRCGFVVAVGVTGTPEVGVTSTSIQTWIGNLYDHGTAELPAPSFVLFVGDVAQVPTFIMGSPSYCTDRFYCAVDSDVLPDMYYGRLPAADATQLQRILDKTMAYERLTMPDLGYLAGALLIGGMDPTYGPLLNGPVNYGTANYFNAAHGVTSDTYLYPDSGAQADAIIADASEGRGFIDYEGHGITTAWLNPEFLPADVNSLGNIGRFGVVFGNACLTGAFNLGECFGETWLRAPDKGAVAYIGCSSSGGMDEGFYFDVGYRAAIDEYPTYDASGLGAFDGLFHDHGEDIATWYVTTSAFVFCGNLAILQSGSPLSTYHWNIYNVLGDPSLSPYLGLPIDNPVGHPAAVSTGDAVLEITAAPNSYCGLTQDGLLVGAGTVGATGSGAIPMRMLVPDVPLHLVVTAQARRPYEADLAVSGAPPAGLPFAPLANGPLGASGPGRGVSLADVDGDGDLDIFVTSFNAANRLLRNDGNGSFVDIAAGAIAAAGPATGAVWADYDNDGSLDAYLVECGQANRLLHNEGAGVFTDNATAAMVADTGAGGAAAWADYDLDGKVDLYVVNEGAPNKLYRSFGDPGIGRWLFFDQGFELSDTGLDAGATWGDYDNNGRPDLYVAYQIGASRLWFNSPGYGFQDATQGCVANGAHARGPAWGDYDDDGLLDLFVANDGAPDLLIHNEGGGAFTCVSGGALDEGGYARSGAWGDYDNDGDLDLYVTRRGEVVYPRARPDRLLRNDGCGVFTAVPTGLVEVAGSSTGCAWGDLDGDGVLDLYVASDGGPAVLLRGLSGAGNHWLELDLAGQSVNRSAIGARVRAVTDGHAQFREVSGGSGYFSQNPLRLHFGLGNVTTVDTLQVRWPGGEVQTLCNVPVDRCLTIQQGQAAGADLPVGPPVVLRLYPCRPNPFNPRTTIRYDLPAAGPVRLAVFDLAGRLVRTLVDGQRSQGRHETVWDGRDAAGRDVASGTYLARLESGAACEVVRMGLVR